MDTLVICFSACIWLDTVSQSRPLVSILKKKHPTTGEGASVVTKRQKIQPTAEESPEERAPVELRKYDVCKIPHRHS